MRRCNKTAVWFSPNNGYRACAKHVEDGMLLCAEAGPAPFGRCDKPIETKQQFRKRYGLDAGPSHADLAAAEQVDSYWDGGE